MQLYTTRFPSSLCFTNTKTWTRHGWEETGCSRSGLEPQRLEVGAAAGVTPNLQEKPSRDTTTDGFLCILQHICLGRDPWDWAKGAKCGPLTEKRQRTACASEGCYSCVLPVLAPEVPFSYPALAALRLSCKFMSRTQGKKNKVGMHKDCKI